MEVKTKHVLVASLALLFMVAAGRGGAQTLPPVTTEWRGPLIWKGVALPEASYEGAVSVDCVANGTCVAVWNRRVEQSQFSTYFSAQFARSSDKGKTWTEPKELLPTSAQSEPIWRGLHAVAAGDNGTWMALMELQGFAEEPTTRFGVVISNDSGFTWGGFHDLTDELQFAENENFIGSLDIGYCGNSTWMFLISTNVSVRYLRSTDNGETWGENIILQGSLSTYPAAIHDYANGTVLVSYFDNTIADPDEGDTGSVISRLSYDNGATFGPPHHSFAGATDGNGNWVLADGYDSNFTDSPIRLKHSSNNGQTFRAIPGPPPLKDLNLDPTKVAYSKAGEIVLVAHAGYCAGFVCVPYSGFVTRTGNLGQTWTPWERLQDMPAAEYPVDVSAVGEDFVAVMNHWNQSAPDPRLISLRLDLEPLDSGPTAARDWQVYE